MFGFEHWAPCVEPFQRESAFNDAYAEVWGGRWSYATVPFELSAEALTRAYSLRSSRSQLGNLSEATHVAHANRPVAG
jgi:hypothetical protein